MGDKGADAGADASVVVDGASGLMVLIPPKPIKRGAYLCDSEFHTESIRGLYVTESDYAVIHVDGQDTTFYNLNGNALTRIGRYSVQLPRDHDQGGQSQNRIQRLRREKIQAYLKRIGELAVKHYIDRAGALVSVKGLIIVGVAQKKDQLLEYLDPRLRSVLIDVLTDTGVSVRRLLEVIAGETGKEARERFREMEEVLAIEPDRLVFGETECMELLGEGQLSRLYVDSDGVEHVERQCGDVGCELMVISGGLLDKYGGLVGMRWY